MLRRINITLLAIALLLLFINVGYYVYVNRVDISNSPTIQHLEKTLNP